jgi:tRNA pseudouridine55 synthase
MEKYTKVPLSELNFQEGAMLLVDKPLIWTSFNVVNKVKWLTKSKTGHAGTLDPLATGLLLLCTGKFTKQLMGYTKLDKEYTGTFVLGATTPTYDLESQPENFKSTDHLTEAQLIEALQPFTGPIQQVPPAHSAIKKDGKPIYLLARKGIDVEIQPRNVTVYEFEITAIRMPEIDFRIKVSSGTYIRSLANDYGAALGCGGYLKSLRRTEIGVYRVEDAYTMEELIGYFRPEQLEEYLAKQAAL